MLVLRGAPALSGFRLEKVQGLIRDISSHITGVSAEFVHFADLNADLSFAEKERLQHLLKYGPGHSGAPGTGHLFLVVPRPGTISPWSSKATEIAHNCGLDAVVRLERGIAYYVESEEELESEIITSIEAVLHDRMVEAVLGCLDDAKVLFERTEPSPLQEVDLLDFLVLQPRFAVATNARV